MIQVDSLIHELQELQRRYLVLEESGSAEDALEMAIAILRQHQADLADVAEARERLADGDFIGAEESERLIAGAERVMTDAEREWHRKAFHVAVERGGFKQGAQDRPMPDWVKKVFDIGFKAGGGTHRVDAAALYAVYEDEISSVLQGEHHAGDADDMIQTTESPAEEGRPKSIREQLVDACRTSGLNPAKMLRGEDEMAACHQAWEQQNEMRHQFSTTMKEGDIFTLASHFKRRTFWDWLTRKPRQLQPLVVTRVCDPYVEYEAANAGNKQVRPKP